MKKNIFVFLFLSLSCASPKPATSPAVKKATKQDPVSVLSRNAQFTLRPFRTLTLENGLKIFLIEDSSLPRVSLHLLVRVGLMQEAPTQSGLNALTAGLLDQGTAKRSATELADQFGQLGTELTASPGPDFTFLSVDALSKDKEKVLELFADVVMNPSFNVTEVERLKSQFKAQIQKKVDNPSSYTDDEFERFLFGNHPYARDIMGEVSTISKISKSHLIKHYLTWYRPNNAALAVVGHFGDDYENLVASTFKSWSSRGLKQETVTEAPTLAGLQVKLISKPGLKQTQIRLGRPGVERKNEDYLVLRAANEILGGGMSSRLMQRVRDDLGLTYGVSSAFDFRRDKGSFTISTFTKNESAGRTLEETIKVYNQFVEKGVSEKELMAAKAQMIGQFPRALETPDRYAFNLLVLDFYGIPFDYLSDYLKNVESITEGDVNRVIKKYLAPQEMKVLVYGDEKQILKQLEPYKPEVIRVKP